MQCDFKGGVVCDERACGRGGLVFEKWLPTLTPQCFDNNIT